VAHINSGERLSGQQNSKWGIKGMGGLVTSRDDSGAFENWRGHREGLGRWRWMHDCVMRSPVIANKGK
jgi:hypothetical protein